MKTTKKLSMLILGGLLALGVGAGLGSGRVETAKAASPETLTCTLGSIVSNTMTFSTTSFTINHYKGKDSNYAAYGSPWRVYTNNYVTIVPKAAQQITKIVINASSASYANAAIGWINTSTDGTPTTLGTSTNDSTIARSVSGSAVTITPASGVSAIKIKPNAQSRWSSIVITFDEGAPVTLTRIAVTTPPTKTSYAVGETLDLTGLVVTGTYSDSNTANVTAACTFSPTAGTTLNASHTSVTVSHTGVSSTSFPITVSSDPAISIDKDDLEIIINTSDTIQVSPVNFTSTPTVTAIFDSTGSNVGDYASASVNGLVVTITGNSIGEDLIEITATYGSESDTRIAYITIIPVPSVTETATLIYSGSTTNMTGNNDASLVNLGSKPFSAVGIKGQAGNNIGLNAAGQLRLYFHATGGNILEVTLTDNRYSITGLEFNFGGTVAKAEIKVDGTVVYSTTPSSGGKETFGSLSATSFTLQNVNSTNTQLYLLSIVISYQLKGALPVLESLSTQGSLTTATQYAGSTLDVSGLTFIAGYSSGDPITLALVQLNSLPTLVLGTTTYQVSYTEGEITVSTNVTLTAVIADSLSSLSWTNRTTTYNEGQTLAEGTIKAIYTSGNEVSKTLDDITIYLFEGTFDVSTAIVITKTTTLVNFDHDGLKIQLGLDGIYTTSSTLIVNFVPTTTYSEGSGTGDTATLIKDVADLNVGDKVLVAAHGYDFVMAESAANGNNRLSVAATKSGDKITGVNELTMTVITLVEGTKTNSFGFSVSDGYLAAGSSSSNYLNTKTSLDDNGSFAITISSTGEATALAQGTITRNSIRFNNGNDPKIFSCYASGQSPIAFYSLDAAGSSGYNYNYLLEVLDGYYCTMDLEGLNKIYTRYTLMTENEIAHFNIEVIVGDDTNSYTGLEAYTEAMIRRALLTPDPSSGNFGEDTAINEENSIAFIVIVAVLGVTAIGAFFFTRRKETN